MVKIHLSKMHSIEGDNLRIISLKDWLSEGERLFGSDKKEWKFRCPNCGHIQTINDFLELKKLNIIKPDVDIGSIVYYSCIGRFDTRIPQNEIGTISDKKNPCNYTNGGLFCFSDIFVIGEDGEKHPVFDFVRSITPD